MLPKKADTVLECLRTAWLRSEKPTWEEGGLGSSQRKEGITIEMLRLQF